MSRSRNSSRSTIAPHSTSASDICCRASNVSRLPRHNTTLTTARTVTLSNTFTPETMSLASVTSAGDVSSSCREMQKTQNVGADNSSTDISGSVDNDATLNYARPTETCNSDAPWQHVVGNQRTPTVDTTSMGITIAEAERPNKLPLQRHESGDCASGMRSRHSSTQSFRIASGTVKPDQRQTHQSGHPNVLATECNNSPKEVTTLSDESQDKTQLESGSATGTELDEACDINVVTGVALLRNILKDFATVKVMSYDPATDDLELVIENSEVSGEEDTLQIGHGTLDAVLEVCDSVWGHSIVYISHRRPC